jgi:hypothetical protein
VWATFGVAEALTIGSLMIDSLTIDSLTIEDWGVLLRQAQQSAIPRA